MRAIVGAVLALVLPATALTVVAAPPGALAAAPAPDPGTIGTSMQTAAGSCWEIKQLRPSAPDGPYWLLTPSMPEPRQHYCDMTTDGGGWVLIGKGRDAWTNDYEGKGEAGALLSPVTSPMSSETVQLPAGQVDELLGGARVDSLAEGVRIRRARDTAGSVWQEVRVRYASRSRWTWTFGAEFGLGGYSFDGTTGSGGVSTSFGLDNAYRRVHNTTNATMGYRTGFAYGSQVTGSSGPTSHLYSATNGAGYALPYSLVYLRPRVTSTDARFTAIPDSGTPPITRPRVLRSTALPSPWGVSDTRGATTDEGSVEVQAFTQSGERMYVGGNFRYVQRDQAGTDQVEQSFLAAFDVATGEWVPSFRPVLNEQVRGLATLPNGQVVAVGDFTQVNGQPAAAIVALDPVTGATSTTWTAGVENRITGATLKPRTVQVAGPYVYVGGAVTHFVGGTRTTPVYMRGLGRLSSVDGTPSLSWNPNLNGTVVDVDASADLSRVYASGYFTTSNGLPANKAAAILNTDGAPLASPAWNPTWSASKNYQQAIEEAGDKVWVGGSEHNLFQFDTGTFARVGGNILKTHGDIQALTADRGVVYAGCHCDQYDYSGAYTWPTLGAGWTRADAIGWFGAWDAATGERIPQFVPTFNMRLNQGIWALQADTGGTMWAGGDIVSVRTNAQQARWSGGFTRFPLADSTAPAVPTGLHVLSEDTGSVSLAWDSVTDPSGGVRYQVLRDDRPVATTAVPAVTLPRGGTSRFFVRAVDAAGNVSASTEVLDLGAPAGPTATFTWSTSYSRVDLDGSGSSPSADIVEHRWDFGDNSGARGATASHTYAAAGSYTVRLTVTDSTGATGTTGQTVTVGAPANPAPADVYGREIHGAGPWAYYRLGEAGGTTARDAGPDRRHGSYSGSVVHGVEGALRNSNDPAIAINGANGNNSSFAVSPAVPTVPAEFSAGVWFRTTSNRGGRLIGYASSATGLSSNYDRHLFLRSDGLLVFGVYNGAEQRVTSTRAYNDGGWHYAMGTMSSADGMRLYVDGALVGSNPTTVAQSFAGYWKVGGDRVWSGAATNNLAGSLDEAVVYARALTPAEVAEQYRLGSTVVEPPTNAPPTAAFTATVTDLAGTFDAGASTDPDGPVATYSWDFGDGTQATGQLVTHAFPGPGEYTVTLTVADDLGALDSTSQQVTAQAPPVETTVVPAGSSWRWRYDAAVPDPAWNALAFDASSWNLGDAVLGFPAGGVATNVDTYASTADRPKAAYFVRRFTVPDPAEVVRLVLRTVADDGVVVYVNGTEVARANMPTGPITNQTFASSARRTSVANTAPVVVEVPVGLLVTGENVVAAETHLNYRGTADISFDLSAALTAYD